MKGLVAITTTALLVIGCGDGPGGASDLDTQMREALAEANVTPLSPLPAKDPPLCGWAKP